MAVSGNSSEIQLLSNESGLSLSPTEEESGAKVTFDLNRGESYEKSSGRDDKKKKEQLESVDLTSVEVDSSSLLRTINEEVNDLGEEKISLLTVHNYKPGDRAQVYLPGLPVISSIESTVNRRAQFKILLEHGPFKWTVYRYYLDFLSLRRDLSPLRIRLRIGRWLLWKYYKLHKNYISYERNRRGRRHAYLPHLLSFKDANPLQNPRINNQMPKVRRFLNAVLNDRQLRGNRSTLKFLEISRISFIEDIGAKRKEGLVSKRSGGRTRVTNCLGCTACCVCRFSFWRLRWLVLKDSFLVYIRSDRHSVSSTLLFDEGTTVHWGIRDTGIQHGLKITTRYRELLVKCTSQKAMKEWKNAIIETLNTAGKIWVDSKRFDSFAPPRQNCTVKWFVDGHGYMSEVAQALLAAKEEIFITDWMMSPHILLHREGGHKLDNRLDKILLKKADQGVRILIQLYKEVPLTVPLGSEIVQNVLKHPNIVVFRHPEHISTGIYLWAHHEKVVLIDQTLAFIGGLDLCFGRYDDHCHCISDNVGAPPQAVHQLAQAAAAMVLGHHIAEDQVDSSTDCAVYQKWVGKDYYNPYISDFVELQEPLQDQLDRGVQPRMPWHDIAACVYGAPARDLARHFIQRYNFTRNEQSQAHELLLLPRREFTGSEFRETEYLHDVIRQSSSVNASVQVLRSVGEWSAGIQTEQSILNAYLHAIENAQHFIYIENQFFISSLPDEGVKNGIAEALRLRIAQAYREKQTFRVIVVMPLLPSFDGEFGETSGTRLQTVSHLNFRTISRGEDSLCGRLMKMDGIPEKEISQYISVYGLRTHGQMTDSPVSEIIYVHSKCMIIDDKLTIIGSANVNDRSMLGYRDSELAIIVEDNDLIESNMNGKTCAVGKFSHTLRCHLFKEHLGILDEQLAANAVEYKPDIDVRDPVCDEFYFKAWMQTAEKNMEIYEEVLGGKNIPTDSVHSFAELKTFKNKPGLISTDVDKAKELFQQTRGSLVTMPLRFLEVENLMPDVGTVESFAPYQLFT